MIKRTVDISDPAYLYIKNRQLCVEKKGKLDTYISIEDLGVLILQHPGIVITQSVVTQCQKNNTAIIFCGTVENVSSLALVAGEQIWIQQGCFVLGAS